jgi:hypothetical protein
MIARENLIPQWDGLGHHCLHPETPSLPNPAESRALEILEQGAPAAGRAHACDGYLSERARRIPPAGEFSGTSGEGGKGGRGAAAAAAHCAFSTARK